MNRFVLLCIAALAFGGIGGAHAQDLLDMKGSWSGTGKGIVDGLAAHHPPSAPAKSAGTHRLTEVPFTLKIEGQDDHRFWGILSSPFRVENVIGVISADGKQIYLVTQDGFLDGVVRDNDTIDTCYRQLQQGSAVAACNTYKRGK